MDLGRVWTRAEPRGPRRMRRCWRRRGAASRARPSRRANCCRRAIPIVPEFRAGAGARSGKCRVAARAGLPAAAAWSGRRRPSRSSHHHRERRGDDLLSAAQLGFLYLGRGDRLNAMPLLERVLRGRRRGTGQPRARRAADAADAAQAAGRVGGGGVRGCQGDGRAEHPRRIPEGRAEVPAIGASRPIRSIST